VIVFAFVLGAAFGALAMLLASALDGDGDTGEPRSR
jgi:hypothetical protein